MQEMQNYGICLPSILKTGNAIKAIFDGVFFYRGIVYVWVCIVSVWVCVVLAADLVVVFLFLTIFVLRR